MQVSTSNTQKFQNTQNYGSNVIGSPFSGQDIEWSLKPKAMAYFTRNARNPLFFIVVLKAPLKHHLIAPRKRWFRFQNDHQGFVIQLQNWKLLDTCICSWSNTTFRGSRFIL